MLCGGAKASFNKKLIEKHSMNVAQWRQRATGRYPVPNRYVLVPVLDCNADEQAILCSEITGNVVLRAP